MNKKITIKELFFQSTRWMRILATIPLVVSVMIYTNYLMTYQRAVDNINQANNISSTFRTYLLEDVWDLVYGTVKPDEFSDDNIIKDVNVKIREIQLNTKEQNELATLNLATEAIDSLESHIRNIQDNIVKQRPMAENEKIMKQVEASNLLVLDILQEFVEVEIQYASTKGSDVMQSVIVLSVIEVMILIITFIFSRNIKQLLTVSVEEPLEELVHMSNELAKGNLDYRMTIPRVTELDVLARQMNDMASSLQDLIEENTKKHYSLAQSEMKILQAQITPHFIYNTLDAILALAEQDNMAAVQEMTYALSDFFRISLSKGQDWISVDKEVRHVADYLLILKMRYGQMLTYDISVPENLKDHFMLKMLLQPLVENAIYHGTKNVRRIGLVRISAELLEESIRFIISDNGKGVTAEQLNDIQAELNKGIDTDFHEGYGLYNVNKRLLLYYGQQAKLEFESEWLVGTTVTVTLPLHKDKQEVIKHDV